MVKIMSFRVREVSQVPHQNRTGRSCTRKPCDDKHPYHLTNGKISRSIRPFVGGLLSDETEAYETRYNRRVTGFVSQSDYDTLLDELLESERALLVDTDTHEHCTLPSEVPGRRFY